jgi:phospholipid/cholesterol/gamma-HCH transport system substrate-binding protein
MENKAHAIAAGIFTLLLTAALIAAAFWIRGEPIAHDNYVLHTQGNVAGLNVQAPVRYRGVEVGKVESIAFDPADARTILVGIAVTSGTPLTKGTYAELAAQGITGLSYVQLGDDGKSARLRNPGEPGDARIELRPSFMDRVSDSGEQLVARVAELARRVDTWLADENKQQVMKTLAALEAAARGVTAVSESVQASVKGVPELAQQAGTTLRNADMLMADLRALTGKLGDRTQTLDRIGSSAERISASVEQLGATGTALGAAASRETMPRLNQLLEELSRNSRNLGRLIDDLNTNPSSLVFGKATPVPGPGEPGFVHGAAR